MRASIDGLAPLRSRLGQVDDGVLDPSLEAAAAALARAADPPRRTGRLDASLTSRGAAVISPLPYAGVINYGWPAHRIEAAEFVEDAWQLAAGPIDTDAQRALDDTLTRY